jgi:hypothetical protein
LPRYETKLPVILSKEEVKALLEAPRQLGQRAIMATLYGAGLRLSEVTHLKVSDLDRKRKVICVPGGKGHKDRQVMLSDSLREVLVAWWRWAQPAEWLFPGEKPGRPLSRETVFRTCKDAARLAKAMNDHRPEVADVFRTYEKDFFAKWGHVLGPQQRKAFEAIRDCRTAALGGHVEYVEQWDTCGHKAISYNSSLMGSLF